MSRRPHGRGLFHLTHLFIASTRRCSRFARDHHGQPRLQVHMRSKPRLRWTCMTPVAFTRPTNTTEMTTEWSLFESLDKQLRPSPQPCFMRRCVPFDLTTNAVTCT